MSAACSEWIRPSIRIGQSRQAEGKRASARRSSGHVPLARPRSWYSPPSSRRLSSIPLSHVGHWPLHKPLAALRWPAGVEPLLCGRCRCTIKPGFPPAFQKNRVPLPLHRRGHECSLKRVDQTERTNRAESASRGAHSSARRSSGHMPLARPRSWSSPPPAAAGACLRFR